VPSPGLVPLRVSVRARVPRDLRYDPLQRCVSSLVRRALALPAPLPFSLSTLRATRYALRSPEYTYLDAAFVVREDQNNNGGEGANDVNQNNPPRRLLKVAAHLDVYGSNGACPVFTMYPKVGEISFQRLVSLSLHNVHVREADLIALADLRLKRFSLRDSQTTESMHDLLRVCDHSVESLVLQSVLCCCGPRVLGFGRRRDRRDRRDGDGVGDADNADVDADDLARPTCQHTPKRLEHLALLGNLRCAQNTCSCSITGDSVRSLHLAKLDDSVVEARGLRGVCRFRGAWSRSWMSSSREERQFQSQFQQHGDVDALKGLDVEGDIDAADLLAILTAGETAGGYCRRRRHRRRCRPVDGGVNSSSVIAPAPFLLIITIASPRSLVVCAPFVALVVRAPGTLHRVRITGEMQHLRGDIGTKIMSSVARLSAAGCRFDFA